MSRIATPSRECGAAAARAVRVRLSAWLSCSRTHLSKWGILQCTVVVVALYLAISQQFSADPDIGAPAHLAMHTAHCTLHTALSSPVARLAQTYCGIDGLPGHKVLVNEVKYFLRVFRSGLRDGVVRHVATAFSCLEGCVWAGLDCRQC